MERAPLTQALTPMQYVVCTLLGLLYPHRKIAAELSISVGTVRHHMRGAMRKIPGDLPAEQRCVAWIRGASLDMLEGKTLRFEIMRDAAPEGEAGGH